MEEKMALLTKSRFDKMIEISIPVRKAIFQAAVNNGDGTPENQFDVDSGNKSRQVNMWAHLPSGLLICEHKGVYFYTPQTNVVEGFFK